MNQPTLVGVSLMFLFFFSVLIQPIQAFSAGANFACTNNDLCDAIDLGQLGRGASIGDASLGIYDNLCADNVNEPNPFDEIGIWNDAAVWFTFRTDANPGPLIQVDARNDPEGTGETIDIELSVYKAVDGLCTGLMELIPFNIRDLNGFDGRLFFPCLEPNTVYYLMVDGGGADPPNSYRGNFGLEIKMPLAEEAGNTICEAEYLGVVPEGGIVQTPELRSNYCADAVGDPASTNAFQNQVSVWFSFDAPLTGHVILETIGDTTGWPLQGQLALYQSSNETCTGLILEVDSGYDPNSLNQSLEISCLNPGERYWALVDGFGAGGIGTFDFVVREAGDITPKTFIDSTICAGDQIEIGSSAYFRTGNYVDTFSIAGGCDSIVFTNLLVLEPLSATITQTNPAIGIDGENGEARVDITGGTGNYTVNWCTGETGLLAEKLEAGTNCCVQIEDDLGCSTEVCFDVAFRTIILPSFTNDSLLCFGDGPGRIRFSFSNGVAPYTYTWQSVNDPFTFGSGTANIDNQQVEIQNLSPGAYDVSVSDGHGDTTFTILVVEPELLQLEVVEHEDVSCFDACDGMIELKTTGGSGIPVLRWKDNTSPAFKRTNLCADIYEVEVIDANLCRDDLTLTIFQPGPFEATGIKLQDVSCFDGSDGSVSIETNGNPIDYDWSNGFDGDTATTLVAGEYSITVTNENDCRDTVAVQVTEPDSPLEVAIIQDSEVSCFGMSNGGLSASAFGPTEGLVYRWSSGSIESTLNMLNGGVYSLEVENSNGCIARDSFVLEEPSQIKFSVDIQHTDCLVGPQGGVIAVDSVSGGRGGFQFRLGEDSRSSGIFNRLEEGTYLLTVKDKSGCEEEVEIEIEGPPDLFVDLGLDVTIIQGDTLLLLPFSNSNDLDYSWSVSDRFNQISNDRLHVFPLSTEMITLEVRDTVNHCTASDQIIIFVKKDRRVFMPNSFSPNGDQLNDLFIIFGGNGTVEVKDLKIFSRNGSLLYQDKDFNLNATDRGWDGRFNGELMSAGTYVYMVEISFVDGTTEVFAGDFVLMR